MRQRRPAPAFRHADWLVHHGLRVLAAIVACVVFVHASATIGALAAGPAAFDPSESVAAIGDAAHDCCPADGSSDAEHGEDEDRESSPESSDDEAATHEGPAWFASGAFVLMTVRDEARSAFTSPQPRPSRIA